MRPLTWGIGVGQNQADDNRGSTASGGTWRATYAAASHVGLARMPPGMRATYVSRMSTVRPAAVLALICTAGLLTVGCSPPWVTSVKATGSATTDPPTVLRTAIVSRLADRQVEVFEGELAAWRLRGSR